jgi:hypothetical protein
LHFVFIYTLYADRMYSINGLNLGLRSLRAVRARISPSLSRQARSLHVSEIDANIPFHLYPKQTRS